MLPSDFTDKNTCASPKAHRLVRTKFCAREIQNILARSETNPAYIITMEKSPKKNKNPSDKTSDRYVVWTIL